MDEELLKEFLQWYWREIHGKPYQVSANEVIGWFLEDKSK